MIAAIRRFLADEEGATAVEYAVIAALVAAALVIAVGKLTGGIDAAFTDIANKIAP